MLAIDEFDDSFCLNVATVGSDVGNANANASETDTVNLAGVDESVIRIYKTVTTTRHSRRLQNRTKKSRFVRGKLSAASLARRALIDGSIFGLASAATTTNRRDSENVGVDTATDASTSSVSESPSQSIELDAVDSVATSITAEIRADDADCGEHQKSVASELQCDEYRRTFGCRDVLDTFDSVVANEQTLEPSSTSTLVETSEQQFDESDKQQNNDLDSQEIISLLKSCGEQSSDDAIITNAESELFDLDDFLRVFEDLREGSVVNLVNDDIERELECLFQPDHEYNATANTTTTSSTVTTLNNTTETEMNRTRKETTKRPASNIRNNSVVKKKQNKRTGALNGRATASLLSLTNKTHDINHDDYNDGVEDTEISKCIEVAVLGINYAVMRPIRVYNCTRLQIDEYWQQLDELERHEAVLLSILTRFDAKTLRDSSRKTICDELQRRKFEMTMVGIDTRFFNKKMFHVLGKSLHLKRNMLKTLFGLRSFIADTTADLSSTARHELHLKRLTDNETDCNQSNYFICKDIFDNDQAFATILNKVKNYHICTK